MLHYFSFARSKVARLYARLRNFSIFIYRKIASSSTTKKVKNVFPVYLLHSASPFFLKFFFETYFSIFLTKLKNMYLYLIKPQKYRSWLVHFRFFHTSLGNEASVIIRRIIGMYGFWILSPFWGHFQRTEYNFCDLIHYDLWFMLLWYQFISLKNRCCFLIRHLDCSLLNRVSLQFTHCNNEERFEKVNISPIPGDCNIILCVPLCFNFASYRTFWNSPFWLLKMAVTCVSFLTFIESMNCSIGIYFVFQVPVIRILT